jgi:peptidoglycan hydrolase-like protein with peptidoglycan-binding domain
MKRLGVLLIALSLLPGVLFAETSSSEELRAQIDRMEEIIEGLRSRMGVVAGVSVDAAKRPAICKKILSRNLVRGSRDTASNTEVSDLQSFLASEYPDLKLKVTGTFDASTEVALKKFQAKEKVVVSGSADTTGYGAVGPKTRAALQKRCALRFGIPNLPDPKPFPPTTSNQPVAKKGSIKVCKVVRGTAPETSDHQFSIYLWSQKSGTVAFPGYQEDSKSVTFTYPLNGKERLSLSGEKTLSAECAKSEPLAYGTYYYSPETIKGTGWASPRYFDGDKGVGRAWSEFAIFAHSATAVSSQSPSADGKITLSASRPHRTLWIANTYLGDQTETYSLRITDPDNGDEVAQSTRVTGTVSGNVSTVVVNGVKVTPRRTTNSRARAYTWSAMVQVAPLNWFAPGEETNGVIEAVAYNSEGTEVARTSVEVVVGTEIMEETE